MPEDIDGRLRPNPFAADGSDEIPVEVETEEWHVPVPKTPPGWTRVSEELVHPPALETVEQKQAQQAEQTIVPEQMIGPYDAWLGIVGQIHTSGTNTLSGYKQEIYVVRGSVHYQTNNDPQGYAVASVGSQVGSTGVTALPWPVRHDQAEYLATVGDIVTVLSGRDGRHWYMIDDEPFLAQVRSDGGAVTEANAGGAGLTALTVIRKALAGDPTATVLTGFSDLQDKDSSDVTYSDVIPVGPANVAHGYRCGDLCWVFRRGRYMFCDKMPKTFVAEIQTTGPGAEADFTTGGQGSDTNHYWFKEQTPTIGYSNNQWTVEWAALTQTDPTGSGGRYGRWGDAENVAEATDQHSINSGTKIVITEVADASGGEIGYVFSMNPSGTDIYIGTVTEYTGGTSVAPCDKITFKSGSNVTVDVQDDGGGDATVEISSTDTKIGEVKEVSGGGSIAPCEKISFQASNGSTVDVSVDGGDASHAIVTIGLYNPTAAVGILFPVVLTQTGGSQGTYSTAASWTYTVDDINSNELATELNPVDAPHTWTRPTVGQMRTATAGYAYYAAGPTLVVGWTNEVAEQEACA